MPIPAANPRGTRSSDIRLTPWEIGHPDLPRQRERPRVAPPGGVSFSAFAEDAHASTRSISFHHGNTFPPWGIRVARACAPRCRGAAATGARALRRDAPTRAAQGRNTHMGARRPDGLPVGDSRQCGASIEHASAARVRIPSGARGAAVAYAEAWEKVLHERTIAQRKSNGSMPSATGSNPVRPPLDSSDG